jgi:hypothetical protein
MLKHTRHYHSTQFACYCIVMTFVIIAPSSLLLYSNDVCDPSTQFACYCTVMTCVIIAPSSRVIVP